MLKISKATNKKISEWITFMNKLTKTLSDMDNFSETETGVKESFIEFEKKFGTDKSDAQIEKEARKWINDLKAALGNRPDLLISDKDGVKTYRDITQDL